MTDVTAIERIDITAAELASPVRRTKTVRALGWLSEGADQPQLMTICVVTIVAGMLRRDQRLTRCGVRMLAAEILATKIKGAIKHRIDRTRPRVLDDGGDYVMAEGTSHESDLTSFPSGHTAGAVAVARALTREYPEHRTPAYAASAAVAAIQVPRCQHYPSDLAAGAVIGLLAEVIIDAGWKALAGRDAKPAHAR